MLRYASLLLGVFLILDSSAPAQTVKWTFKTDGTAAAPTLYPCAEKPEGVVIAAGNKVTLLEGNGAVRWTAELAAKVTQPITVLGSLPARDVGEVQDSGSSTDPSKEPKVVMRPPTPEELDRGKRLLLAVLEDASIVCLDDNGKTNWTVSLAENGCPLSCIAADFMMNEGMRQILVSRMDGSVYCLSDEGQIRWRFFGDKFRASVPAIGDVDGDGFSEVVYGTDNGHVYCLDRNGAVKWRWTGNMPFGRSGINLADLNGDGTVEVLLARSNAGRDCGLFALEGATGKLLWHAPTEMQEYLSLATVDLDGDGRMETVHGDKGNFLYCTNADGTERWRKELSGRGIFTAPVVGDVDGDGKPEILVGVRDNDPITGASHFLVRADGSEATPIKLGGGGGTATAMGDMDGDGILEVVAATPGAVQCLTWGGMGRALWGALRGNSAMNGRVNAPFKAASNDFNPLQDHDLAVNAGDCYWGENTVRVSWPAPAAGDAFLSVSVQRGFNSKDIRIVPVDEGATSAEVPVTLAPPTERTTVVFELFATGTLGPLGRVTHTFTAGVLSHETVYEEFRQAFGKLSDPGHRGPRPILKAISGGLENALYEAENTGYSVHARDNHATDNPNALWDLSLSTAGKSTEFRRRAVQSLCLLNGLCQFWDAGGKGSFVCWQDLNPWDNFDPHDVPEKFETAPPITVTAFGDEFEDVALNLLNITDRPVGVRCVFSKPKLSGGAPDKDPELAKHITLRRGVMVPDAYGVLVPDALPELDLSRTITLSPLEASQLWLVVDTHGLEAGTHTLTLYLGSLEETCTLREIPVTIEVLPTRLPEGVYAQMNWVGTDVAETSDQQLKDMLDHGISVAYGPRLPLVPVDAQGAATVVPDWTGFDKSLDRLPKWFQVTFAGPPALQWPEGRTPASDSTEANTGFATAVRALASHLADKGWGYDRWVFYPYDEPWLTGHTIISDLRKSCERVKTVDPKIRNYADPTGMMRVPQVAEFKDLIDVWQPEVNVLKRDPELLQWFQQNAKTLWAYEATDPGKNMLSLGYYRAYGWTAWKLGLKGAGFWCYKYHDAWWPLETTDWSVVYQTGDQVTPSRRWEACRDGQEDYRALYALRAEAEKARTAGRTAAADHATAAISEMVDRVVGWQMKNIDEITRQTRDYEIDFNLIKQNRTRIAAELAALQKEEAK